MNKSSLIDYYKRLHLEMKKYGKPAGPERIDIIQKNIGKGKTILDVGCRDGTLYLLVPFTRDHSHLRFFNFNSLHSLLSRYFSYIKIVPFAGYIIGNKRFGMLVTEKTPLWLGKLFSGGFSWRPVKE